MRERSSSLLLARSVQSIRPNPSPLVNAVLDPKVLLMLATGTLLLLNGLIARAAAAKREPNEVNDSVNGEQAGDRKT